MSTTNSNNQVPQVTIGGALRKAVSAAAGVATYELGGVVTEAVKQDYIKFYRKKNPPKYYGKAKIRFGKERIKWYDSQTGKRVRGVYLEKEVELI